MKRLSEPSTWAGFATLFQVLGAAFPAYAIALHGATILAGALAVAIPEIGTRQTK